MDQQTSAASSSTLTTVAASSSSTTTTTSQPTEPSPPPPQLSAAPPTPPAPTPSTTPSIPTPNPNPNPNLPPKPSTPLIQPQSQPTTATATATTPTRPHTLHRPWQHPHPHAHSQFSHFTPHSSPSSSSLPAASSSSASISAPQPRGGVAIGVPAAHPTPPPPSFSSSFGQQYGGLNRGAVNVPESVPNTSTSQVRQGMQGMGMMASMSSSSQMRPGGIPAHHQQRPVQSSLRPPSSSPNNQPPTTQNFQGHGFMRSSPLGPSSSSAPSTSQSVQSPAQPWLSSGSQGKPPLPSPSYRPQINTPSTQQRSHIPQQHHHPLPTTSQQQHMAPVQPQSPLPSHQPPDHYGQQFPSSRTPQSIPHPQQAARIQGSVNQKPSSITTLQPNTVQSVPQNRIATAESDESGNKILSKRSIRELVSQIDPSERLDSEVEDILADIADEFVESITTFGCSLAKHRRSDTLEAKDILLHVERNWNMTLPGFGGDEIKSYRKPLTNDIHKERLAVIKKTILASEMANAKNSVGQAAGNAKGNVTRTPTNAMVSSNLKVT